MDKQNILNEIIEKPKPLSEEQKKAVLSEKRYIRIIAGAGTGKTETLTRRIVYLLLYHNVEPKEIVAFTFTEKAAQSMKSRIYQRVKELKGEETCAKLGEMYVGTIHGFCLQILEDYFGYGDYDVLDENQEMAFILRFGWELELEVGGRYAENCKNFIKSVNVVYDELIERKKLQEKAPEFYNKLIQYEKLLDAHRLLTFGRIIALAVQKIKDNPEKLSYIKHLIVDEYQDINKAQEELIKIIGKSASVFIVGDPRQSIYQWRGSDEKCFEKFPEHFENVETISLTENRRSRKEIVEVANEFADTFARGKYEHIKPTREEEGYALMFEVETPEKEAEWIINQIKKYVNSSNNRKYSDCAILLRSVTTSAEPFIKIMREQNIPYIVGGKIGLFKRDEAQALGRLFAWLWDEGFWAKNPWNWKNKITGDKLLDTALELWKNATGIQISAQEREKIRELKEKVKSNEYRNIIEIFQDLLVILRYKELDPDDRLHAPVMANIGRFSSLLADYESSVRLGGNKPDWSDILKGLCWYMNTYASGAYEEQPFEDLRGIDAVQIMTIHQAKGLEWPIVFIPAMVIQRFPSSMVGSEQKWYIPRDIFDVNRYEGGIEDERRLFYVAITRARDILCISYFKRTKNSRQRSQFIADVERRLRKLSSDMDLPLMDITSPPVDDEIKTFSASEILTYMKCPHLYRLRELCNYKPGLVDALGYGKSLHFCLRYAGDLIKNGVAPEDAIKQAVEEKFHVPYAGGKIKENMKKGAKNTLLKFVREHKEVMGKIEEVEVRLEFPIQKVTIVGKVDVILSNEGTREIIDYKTSDEVTTPEQASLQVQLYALGLNMIEKPVNKASLAYLENAELKDVNIEYEKLGKAKEKAEEYIKCIMEGKFEGRPENGYCEHCDYKKICKWGR